MFLSFESLKPYVVIYFVLKKVCKGPSKKDRVNVIDYTFFYKNIKLL